MQEWFTLPDGSSLHVPASASRNEKDKILADLAQKFPSYFGSAHGVKRSKGWRHAVGSVWQGIENIPRGAASVPLMAAQGIAALATPHKDTGVEKALRGLEDHLYSGIDPRYAQGNLSKLGLGLGQAAGFIVGGELAALSGVARGLPAYLSARGVPAFLASTAQRGAAAAALGAGVNTGDAARRIAEYEERTGEDVNMFKEMGALGAAIPLGVTEALPLYGIAGATGILGTGVRKRLLAEGAAGVSGSIFRGALKAAAGEALQESGVELGQTVVARALYDDDALADLGTDLWDSAIIGGQVGGLLSILTNLAMRPMGKRLHGTDWVAEEAIARSVRERDLDETDKRPLSGVIGNLDPEAGEVTPEEEAKLGSILDLSPEQLEERRARHIELHTEAIENRGDPFSQFYDGAPAEMIEQEAARRADLDLAYETERAQRVESDKDEIKPVLGLSFTELDMFGSQPIEDIIGRVGMENGVRSEIILDVFTADRISKLGQDVRSDLRRFVIKNSSPNNRYSSGAVAGAIAGSWGNFMNEQTEESADNLWGGRDLPSEERKRNAVAFIAQTLPPDSVGRQLLETKEYLDPADVNAIIEDASQTVTYQSGVSRRGRPVYTTEPIIKGLDVDNVWDMIYGFRGGVDLFQSIQDRMPALSTSWVKDAQGNLKLKMSDPAVQAENELVEKAVEKKAWTTPQKTKAAIRSMLLEKRIRLPLRNAPWDQKGAIRRKDMHWGSPSFTSLVRTVTGVDTIEATNESQRKALLGHISNLPRLGQITVLPDLSSPTYTADHFRAFIAEVSDKKPHNISDIASVVAQGEGNIPTELMFTDEKALQLLQHTVEAGYVESNPSGTLVRLREDSRPKTIVEEIDTSEAPTDADAAEIEDTEVTNAKSLEELQVRVASLTEDLKARLKRMGLKDVDLILTADADSMVSSVESVMENPENMRDAYAMLDGPVARIMVNLSAVDPNNTLTSKEITQKHLNEEVWHAYRRYGYMYQHEWDTLRSYALQNVVAPEVNEKANAEGLNYVELALELSDAEGVPLNPQDAVEEGVTILMEGLAQGRLPRSKTAGKVGTIRDKMTNFAKNVIDSGRTANLEDVFSVYSLFETGQIGRRGAGYGRLSEAAPVRSLYHSEYADPEMLEELKSAVVEGDEAKQKKIAGQIAEEKVVMRRAAALPREMSATDRILNRVLLDREIGATPKGDIPVLGKNATDLALEEIFRERAGAAPYQMPSAVKYRLRKQDNWVPDADFRDLADRYMPDDASSDLMPGEILIQSTPEMGTTFEETKAAYNKVHEKFLGFFPKDWAGWRDWVADRSINLELQERKITGLHDDIRANAETSAIAAVRFRDAAMNFFDSVLKDGNMTYVGSDLDSGFYKVIPDGGKTLQEFLSMLRGPETRKAFKLYSIAKRMERRNFDKRMERAQKLVAAHEDIEPTMIQNAKDAGFTGPFAMEEYIAQNGALEGYLTPANLTFFKTRSKELKASFGTKGTSKIEPEDAKNIIDEVESSAPHVVEAWNEFQRLNGYVIDWALSVGQITPEMAEVFRDDNFVPFYRDIGMTSAWPMGGNGRNRSKARSLGIGHMREADGSSIFDEAVKDSYDLANMDIVASIVQNQQASIRDGMSNVAAYRAVRDARELTENGFGVQTRRVTKAGPDTLRILVDGEEQYWQMADPKLTQSVMLMGFSPDNVFFKSLRGAGRFLRDAVINYPVFMYRNLMKDGQQAWVVSGSDEFLPIVSSVQKLFDSDMLPKARMAGIATGGNINADVISQLTGQEEEYLLRKIDRRVRRNVRAENPTSILDYAAASWRAYEDFRDKSEAASRMAVYDRTLMETGSEAQAALDGLEIMNYGRRGSSPALNAIMAGLPFMGGMIQGTDVLWRALSGSPDAPGTQHSGKTVEQMKMRAWSRGMMMATVSVLSHLFWSDDEDYQSLDEAVKMNNFFIPIVGTDMKLRLPIAFTTGAIFKALPESVLRYLIEEDYDLSDVGAEVKDQLQRNLDIHVVPQAVRPFMNAMFNYDEFRRDKIVPTWMEDLPPEMQKTDWTSDTSVLLAGLFNWLPEGMGGATLSSPMKLENMIRQYTAYVGILTTMFTDKLIREVTGKTTAGTRHDWSRPENWPVLGDIIDEKGGGRGYLEDYQKLDDAVSLYVRKVGILQEEGDREGLLEYMDENRGLARIHPQMLALGRYMRKWRERRDFIMDSNLPHERKAELLEQHVENRNKRLSVISRLRIRSRV